MVFALGCLKKTLLALVALALLVSIGQLVLLFINNQVFGVVMFVLYLLFFLAILLALCRDSVSMYSAAWILLVIFVIGCVLIQTYEVRVDGLLSLGESTTTEAAAGKFRRSAVQVLDENIQWKQPYTPPPSWEPTDGFQQPSELQPQEPVWIERGVSNLTRPTHELPQKPYDATQTPSQDVTTVNVDPDRPGLREGVSEGNTEPSPKEKKYLWRTELRYVSDVLGLLHILMLGIMVCIVYEMLFGGRYRYRVWC